MSLSKKLMVATLALPLAFGAASSFAAGDKYERGGKGSHGHSDHQSCSGTMGLIYKLDLSDAQKDQLKELRSVRHAQVKSNAAKDIEQKRADREQAHQTMQKIVMADKFDTSAAKQFAGDMANKRAERNLMKMEAEHEMFSVLTAAQKDQFLELQKTAVDDCKAKKKGKDGKRRHQEKADQK
ncbi:Spy/CpxP family protein refolding chaperone [Marinomonas ostreistagni]|uniref:Spy/CpxP family protein refolding chaperone n=1 Tax=Marinomonas ostreistagni TaxID=359209 RepID=A0ABS0Z693_9GAMM|nr:Spy/CpxP family protein refolding chaperone [Marinomonas ostreistagni]MBJ7549179.1 Spy/CpxP family protein refolding chaperone [Marinomonas ostreistagni]